MYSSKRKLNNAKRNEEGSFLKLADDHLEYQLDLTNLVKILAGPFLSSLWELSYNAKRSLTLNIFPIYGILLLRLHKSGIIIMQQKVNFSPKESQDKETRQRIRHMNNARIDKCYSWIIFNGIKAGLHHPPAQDHFSALFSTPSNDDLCSCYWEDSDVFIHPIICLYDLDHLVNRPSAMCFSTTFTSLPTTSSTGAANGVKEALHA